MKFSVLGSSGIKVSRVCLGSMTWGLQNNQADANQQLEYALAQGVNFIDTAEMYAVPPSPDTYGKTETIIGNWLGANKTRRSEIILASKIAGAGLPWVRNGGPITGEAVIAVPGNRAPCPVGPSIRRSASPCARPPWPPVCWRRRTRSGRIPVS